MLILPLSNLDLQGLAKTKTIPTHGVDQSLNTKLGGARQHMFCNKLAAAIHLITLNFWEFLWPSYIPRESIQVVCAGARCRSARSKQDTTKLNLPAALARGCAAQGERNTREIRSSYNRARFRIARLCRQPLHCPTDFGVGPR